MTMRFDVIGCLITRANAQSTVKAVVDRVHNGSGGYICFTNVHASVTARKDLAFQKIINESFMSLPDGKPIYWVGRLKGIQGLGQVAGPDFLSELLGTKTDPPLRHYFYGGRPDVVTRLISRLRFEFPSIDIVGAESPPFRDLSAEEIRQATQRIKKSGANVVWVGLGAPKQEFWMAKNWQELKPALLLGVGAAFDFYAGSVKRAPRWMRKLGLEWFHRLSQEPSRLWRRYLYTNTLFVYYLLKDSINGKPLDQAYRNR